MNTEEIEDDFFNSHNKNISSDEEFKDIFYSDKENKPKTKKNYTNEAIIENNDNFMKKQNNSMKIKVDLNLINNHINNLSNKNNQDLILRENYLMEEENCGDSYNEYDDEVVKNENDEEDLFGENNSEENNENELSNSDYLEDYQDNNYINSENVPYREKSTIISIPILNFENNLILNNEKTESKIKSKTEDTQSEESLNYQTKNKKSKNLRNTIKDFNTNNQGNILIYNFFRQKKGFKNNTRRR